jgi:putative photosynthetic complex assembly protein 2
MPLALSAACYALAACCGAISLIALLDRLRPAAFSWAFSGASLLLVAALVGLALTSRDASPAGALAGFTCGLVAWAWQEAALAPRAPRRRSGGFALGTAPAEELAWALYVGASLALSWDGVNLAARWTLPALWAVHLSLRLNALCAARASASGPLIRPPWFAPGLPAAQLLSSVFPLTVTFITGAAALALDAALAAGQAGDAGVAPALLAGVLAVGAAAHWGMVLRLPAWRLGALPALAPLRAPEQGRGEAG